MRGAAESDRNRKLALAEAVRAGSRLDSEDFEKWVSAVSGQDHCLPPDVLASVLRRAGRDVETISMGDALKRMN